MKKRLKKLALSKETLRALDRTNLVSAAGGTFTDEFFTVYTCDLNNEVCQHQRLTDDGC